MEKGKITLSAVLRDESTKAKALRRQGLIPAIIYGRDSKNKMIAVDKIAFNKVFKDAGQTGIIQLKYGEKGKNVLVYELEHHSVTGEINHIDFFAVKMNEKIITNVPLEFVGEAPAVKELDGTLVRQKDEVEVEALPGDLPQFIEVNIESLKTFDDVIHVSDLKVAEGVKIIDDAEDMVAMIEEPRSEEEMAELEAPIEEIMPEEEKEEEADSTQE
jgi:large subunit ribosomal protein L25